MEPLSHKFQEQVKNPKRVGTSKEANPLPGRINTLKFR
jgi:hypothetical protein